MRYFLKGQRSADAEVDLVLNAPDCPSCPRCGRYNAMLAEYAGASDAVELLKCRDCGVAVEGVMEVDTQSAAQEMVTNASDDAICAGLAFLRSVHGSSCSTVAEYVRMLADTTYGREALYNTSYHRELYGFFAGFVLGGARGSSALLSSYRGPGCVDNPDVPGEPDYCAACGLRFPDALQGKVAPGATCGLCVSRSAPNADCGANKGSY